MTTYIFDIIADNKTKEKFINTFYQYVKGDIKSKYTNNDELMNDIIIQVIEKKLWQKHITEYNTHTVGDLVEVSYIPASQKYIDMYDEMKFDGQIIFIDPEKDNMFLMEKTDKNIIVKSLEREGCHFFGMTRGYEYFIYKKIENM